MESPSPRKPWTRDDLLIALNLYFKTPFGKQHKTNPILVEVAQLMGRSPSSLAMKLNNFTSLDPVEQARGVKGLSGASKADRAIWEELNTDKNELLIASEAALESLLKTENSSGDELPSSSRRKTESWSPQKVRRGQQFFRATILAEYGTSCCITGNPLPSLLRASHIVPWSEDEENRLNPRNGLCLAANHDAAFDRHLITLDEDLRLVLSKELRSYLPCHELERSFVAFEGKRISLPCRYPPDPIFLEQHRYVFTG